MDEAIFPVHFPLGQLPARGFRCPTCGEEQLLGSEAQRLERMAHDVGLFGVEDIRERKLLKTGNSLVVTIDPTLAKTVFGTTRPGVRIRIGRLGKRIVIEPAD
ncbi:MAG TPA: hypothetical protein VGB18_04685 [Candidatus Thermoplasmatota archaeon]